MFFEILVDTLKIDRTYAREKKREKQREIEGSNSFRDSLIYTTWQ